MGRTVHTDEARVLSRRVATLEREVKRLRGQLEQLTEAYSRREPKPRTAAPPLKARPASRLVH